MKGMHRALSLAAVIAIVGAAQLAGAQEATVAPDAQGTWSGPFRSVQMTSASRYTGTVRIAPASGRVAGTVRVELRLRSPGATGFLWWGVSQGRCGTMLQLVVHPRVLPQLELRAGGNAEVSYDGVIALKPDSVYQVVVYKDGQLEHNVVACANVKYEVPKK